MDAGSGIVALGDELTRELRDARLPEQPAINMLFTHAHHDHLCGLPFFAPLYQSSSRLQMLGPDLAGMRFEEIIAGYMRSPYFPIDFRSYPHSVSLPALGTERAWSGYRMPGILSSGVMGTPSPLRSLVVDAFHSQFHPREGTLIYRLARKGGL